MESIVHTRVTRHPRREPPAAEAANQPEDYTTFGLRTDRVEQWEDGAHTNGRAGTYEWWYCDAHLDDGAKLVVVFMTKDIAAPKKPLRPVVRISLDLPDGRSFERVQTFDARDFSMATDTADIRIGDNRFVGDLSTYRITADLGTVAVDLTLESEIAPWRPGTGHMVFGPERQLEFAWLPSVPQGRVSGTYEVNGTSASAAGVGYHDHNWGNIGMTEVIHHWYWARGHAGPYSAITSYITAHKRYGYETIPIFMLAKDGVLLADDASHVTFETMGGYTDAHTGKPVANVTRYTYTKNTTSYVVTYTRHRDLSVVRFTDEASGVKKLLARLVRFDAAYLRFTGELRIDHLEDGTLVEHFVNDAIWELMYFGHARRE